MAELMLDIIEADLFESGLDYKRGFDEERDSGYIEVAQGECRLVLSPLWTSSSKTEEIDFFDNDDINVQVSRYGIVEDEMSVYPDSEEDLVEMLKEILGWS